MRRSTFSRPKEDLPLVKMKEQRRRAGTISATTTPTWCTSAPRFRSFQSGSGPGLVSRSVGFF